MTPGKEHCSALAESWFTESHELITRFWQLTSVICSKAVLCAGQDRRVGLRAVRRETSVGRAQVSRAAGEPAELLTPPSGVERWLSG